MGMFIRREYLSTSWLMMNVLINFAENMIFRLIHLKARYMKMNWKIYMIIPAKK